MPRLNEEEKLGKEQVKVSLSPLERISPGVHASYDCGDLLLLPIYNSLGLPAVYEGIVSGKR